MDKETIKEIKELIQTIEKINNRTENKIDALKLVLIEYNELSKRDSNFGDFSVVELIKDIDVAKKKRVNVSKKSIHSDFLRIKKESLFRIKHNYSILKFRLKKEI